MSLYAVNALTFAPTEYTETSGIDLAEFDGKTLLLATGAVYEQVAGASGTVSGELKTGRLTLAGNQEYNVPKLSFSGEGTGTLTFGRVTQEQGQGYTPDSYSVTLTSGLDQHEMTLETRQHARSYQFTVTFTNAGDKLESWEAYVNPVRHRRG